MLRRFGEFGLKLKPSKCKFFQSKLIYPGHVVSENGVEPEPDRNTREYGKEMTPGAEYLRPFLERVTHKSQTQ